MRESTIFPVRNERTDLKGLIAVGFLAVPLLAWTFWTKLWPDLEAGVVRVPMSTVNTTPTVLDRSGAVIGAGGDITPRIAAELLPDSAVALLRIGEIGGFAAMAAAALIVALLGVRVLRRGLFDRRLPTLVRVSLSLCFMFWALAGVVRGIGASSAVDSLGIGVGGDYWGRGESFPAALFFVFIMLIGWFEVILKAGRRIAKDQDGVI